MVLFGSPACLRALRSSQVWFADGTFKIAPLLWPQPHTTHCSVNGFTLPCVYALLPGKTKAVYEALWSQVFWLLGPGPPVDPVLLLDYEHAVLRCPGHVAPPGLLLSL
ncbi:unnamed protein product [Prorocentrum cordatum]|uniref:MULE transposase domain-containing protein n=1 Tax=Prorocentrum cordatum TaxID=2364126 RepID=A0ABN9Y764_9DINO|nr:unnamed protein product [Polarella glacialis]